MDIYINSMTENGSIHHSIYVSEQMLFASIESCIF